MRERNRRLIGENGDRKLWGMEVEEPGREWVPFFRGEVYAEVQGRRILTPEEAVFFDEKQAVAWLDAGSP